MIRASRAVFVSLLALVQTIAPLVHAHVDGGQSPGFLHVPGLEFLATRSRDLVQPSSQKASPEVIVGLAQGLELSKEPVAPASKLESASRGSSGFSPIALVCAEAPSVVDVSPAPPRQDFSPPSQRAPPQLQSAH